MNIMKNLWLFDFDESLLKATKNSPKKLKRAHLEYARDKINLICENAKERMECYNEIQKIFSDD